MHRDARVVGCGVNSLDERAADAFGGMEGAGVRHWSGGVGTEGTVEGVTCVDVLKSDDESAGRMREEKAGLH